MELDQRLVAKSSPYLEGSAACFKDKVAKLPL